MSRTNSRFLSSPPQQQPYQYHYQELNHSPGPFMGPTPETDYTQSSPFFDFSFSPSQISEMERPALDEDILTNLNYLEEIDFNDFILLPEEETFIPGDFIDDSFFFDFSPQSSEEEIPLPPPPQPSFPIPQQQHQVHPHCCHICGDSFRRPCELKRHMLKHDKPFKCTICGASFAEKRRCLQHIKAHGSATDADRTKCQFCKYSAIRPDAVKRHMRLRHGVGKKDEESPSTGSDT